MLRFRSARVRAVRAEKSRQQPNASARPSQCPRQARRARNAIWLTNRFLLSSRRNVTNYRTIAAPSMRTKKCSRGALADEPQALPRSARGTSFASSPAPSADPLSELKSGTSATSFGDLQDDRTYCLHATCLQRHHIVTWRTTRDGPFGLLSNRHPGTHDVVGAACPTSTSIDGSAQTSWSAVPSAVKQRASGSQRAHRSSVSAVGISSLRAPRSPAAPSSRASRTCSSSARRRRLREK
jgi:hypothetical protein